MTTFRTNEIQQALTKKGFTRESSHHTMLWYYAEGKKTSIRTRLSHGINEYGDNLLGQMARQLRLTKMQLSELSDCALSGDKCLEILVAKKDVVLAEASTSPESDSNRVTAPKKPVPTQKPTKNKWQDRPPPFFT